jgi:sugar phosphate isomerase/epimerase
MRLTVSNYSFEAVPLEATLAICKALGFKAVDISCFSNRGQASYEPDEVGANPQKFADHMNGLLDKYELEGANFFPQLASNFETRSLNNPDPAIRERNVATFRGIVEFCTLTHMHSVTVLPGFDHPQKPLQENLDLAAEMMRLYVDIAGEQGVHLCFEPHVGSVTQTPELARWLADSAPGATVALDYSHFLVQYIPMERIHILLPVTGHFHIRQAKPGRLQTRFHEGTIDFVDIMNRLKAVGFDGDMLIEFVSSEWYNMHDIDILSETAAAKRALEPYIPV